MDGKFTKRSRKISLLIWIWCFRWRRGLNDWVATLAINCELTLCELWKLTRKNRPIVGRLPSRAFGVRIGEKKERKWVWEKKERKKRREYKIERERFVKKIEKERKKARKKEVEKRIFGGDKWKDKIMCYYPWRSRDNWSNELVFFEFSKLIDNDVLGHNDRWEDEGQLHIDVMITGRIEAIDTHWHNDRWEDRGHSYTLTQWSLGGWRPQLHIDTMIAGRMEATLTHWRNNRWEDENHSYTLSLWSLGGWRPQLHIDVMIAGRMEATVTHWRNDRWEDRGHNYTLT